MDFEASLQRIKDQGLYRELTSFNKVDQATVRTETDTYINFTSNDYLGLGQCSRATDMDATLKDVGMHYASSRLVSGNTYLYEAIEHDMSAIFQFKHSLITTSGYAANLAAFSIFRNEPHVMVFSDEKNHASIIDGIKLNRLETVVYPHLDYNTLEDELAKYPHTTKIIVSDSIFSTNGDMVDIDQLKHLKDNYQDTYIILDDAHGLGLNMFQSYDAVDILTSSLSKALGAFGGLIMTRDTMMHDLIINKGRSFIYSGCLPNYNLIQLRHLLDIYQSETYRQSDLKALSSYFNRQYAALFKAEPFTLAPIKAIPVNDIENGFKVHAYLKAHGFLTSFFRYPTVETPMIRLSLTSMHTKSDIDNFLTTLSNFEER
ncbi:aminotransferase class I/II-fold pyridoxal phosphate-dependent enzyme [Staphylococcus massiliensis]|uniref:aminotransferase class I/II-fold pyridoxal phosphate-dependent enzyme n=1 Tax=Staphylococcus massiliensis TaxID=555791 RepID=UPI001EDF8085|nr:pyridoxal phosphate-dependent aminotransferase family protein [Staphylococcus massiliensis]MCG3399509.1 pyridoxal phosphate-dependent aminotransferase family protein [Staphylococcus massiliensis]